MRTPEEIFRQIAETEATITASKKLLKILDEELKQSEWVESGDWYHDPMVFKRRMAYLLSCRGLTYYVVWQKVLNYSGISCLCFGELTGLTVNIADYAVASIGSRHWKNC